MSQSRFQIMGAVKNAYVFVGRERAYLLRIATMPLLANLATAFYLHFLRPQSSPFEDFLWGLPASVLFAWFLFIETRLILLGERIYQAIDDEAARKQAMKAAVTVWLLFNMAMTAVAAYLQWAAEDMQNRGAWVTVTALAVIGLLFWGLRFSVAHILAAVQYPIRQFLGQVKGAEISFRLLGMGLLCVTPVIVVLQLLLNLVLPGAGSEALTSDQFVRAILIVTPVSLLMATLLNAAAVFAVKEILSAERRDA